MDIATDKPLSNLSIEAPAMQDLLKRSLQFESISGHEKAFSVFVANWARVNGFAVDEWQADEADLGDHPLAAARHIPLAGRPTVVITHRANPQCPPGRSLLFNAHADVVAANDPDRWTHPPFGGVLADGKYFGRGACDVKGPMVSALGAMLAIQRTYPQGLAGDVSLELVPGEEDCVGLGTLTSVVRGHSADGVIVLEPTEDQPRIASRGGCRFEIVCHGRSVHGTMKWLGDDAIHTLRKVLDTLDAIEADWNGRSANPLFSSYPVARPITVDSVQAGQWQGMISDRATCGGYLELLPNDEVTAIKNTFVAELKDRLPLSGKDFGKLEVKFSETYDGHCMADDHPFSRLAMRVSASPALAGFNSGCEAGLRAGLLGTPTLVWGPGSLAQAHAVDEFVQLSSVEKVAQQFAAFSLLWCGETI